MYVHAHVHVHVQAARVYVYVHVHVGLSSPAISPRPDVSRLTCWLPAWSVSDAIVLSMVSEGTLHCTYTSHHIIIPSSHSRHESNLPAVTCTQTQQLYACGDDWRRHKAPAQRSDADELQGRKCSRSTPDALRIRIHSMCRMLRTRTRTSTRTLVPALLLLLTLHSHTAVRASDSASNNASSNSNSSSVEIITGGGGYALDFEGEEAHTQHNKALSTAYYMLRQQMYALECRACKPAIMFVVPLLACSCSVPFRVLCVSWYSFRRRVCVVLVLVPVSVVCCQPFRARVVHARDMDATARTQI